jgi:hypothetical protein
MWGHKVLDMINKESDPVSAARFCWHSGTVLPTRSEPESGTCIGIRRMRHLSFLSSPGR